MTDAIYAQCPTYDLLVEAFDARRIELGMSMDEFEGIADLPTGAAGKYLGPSQTKKFGHVTLFKTLRGLGLRLVLEIDPENTAIVLDTRRPARANQARPDNHAAPCSKRVKARVLRHLGERGRKAYKRKVPKPVRSAIARIAAMKRWYPNRVYDWDEIKRAVKP